jgi:hypothetical protein
VLINKSYKVENHKHKKTKNKILLCHVDKQNAPTVRRSLARGSFNEPRFSILVALKRMKHFLIKTKVRFSFYTRETICNFAVAPSEISTITT